MRKASNFLETKKTKGTIVLKDCKDKNIES